MVSFFFFFSNLFLNIDSIEINLTFFSIFRKTSKQTKKMNDTEFKSNTDKHIVPIVLILVAIYPHVRHHFGCKSFILSWIAYFFLYTFTGSIILSVFYSVFLFICMYSVRSLNYIGLNLFFCEDSNNT